MVRSAEEQAAAIKPPEDLQPLAPFEQFDPASAFY